MMKVTYITVTLFTYFTVTKFTNMKLAWIMCSFFATSDQRLIVRKDYNVILHVLTIWYEDDEDDTMTC